MGLSRHSIDAKTDGVGGFSPDQPIRPLLPVSKSILRFKGNTNIGYPLAFGMVLGIVVIKFVTRFIITFISTVDKPCKGIFPCLRETVGLNLKMTHGVWAAADSLY